MSTDTAHEHWNAEWAAAGPGSKWARAEPEVEALAATLPAGARVLDLGAGLGRHALAHARRGHRVTAFDAAPEGLSVLARRAAAEGLAVTVQEGRMTDLPFADASFDHVVIWSVIYHGDAGVVRRTVAEIARVLRPGGTVQGTMLSHRRLAALRAAHPGREVAPGAWVFDAEGDKAHPHFFCDARTLLAIFAGFEPVSLQDTEVETPGKGHWRMILERA